MLDNCLTVVLIVALILFIYVLYNTGVDNAMPTPVVPTPNPPPNINPIVIPPVPSPTTTAAAASSEEKSSFDEGNEEPVFSDPTGWDPAPMSLEKSVYESHHQYVTDDNFLVQGSSHDVVRDDMNDINPWVGLSRIKYDVAVPQDDVRTTSSEYPEQLPRERKGFYF